MTNIQEIESAYKTHYSKSKINKSTKEWKRFYDKYRRGKIEVKGIKKKGRVKKSSLENKLKRNVNSTKSLASSYIWRGERFHMNSADYTDENEAYKVARTLKKDWGTKYRIVPTIQNGKKKYKLFLTKWKKS